MSGPAEPKTINIGGPAFPISESSQTPGYPGMTLRQWYAGKALAGFCANSSMSSTTEEAMARYAFAQADAMIAHEVSGK